MRIESHKVNLSHNEVLILKNSLLEHQKRSYLSWIIHIANEDYSNINYIEYKDDNEYNLREYNLLWALETICESYDCNTFTYWSQIMEEEIIKYKPTTEELFKYLKESEADLNSFDTWIQVERKHKNDKST
jgi:hypothetical protein